MNKASLALELPTVVRRNISNPVAHSLIKGRPSDKYLVSYPRSGSTWLRTILGGIMDPDSGFEPEVFNRLIPSVSGRRLPAIWMLNNPRIIHSHTGFRRGLSKVVYIVRDGRDSVVSFYHYSTTRSGIEIPFEQWFKLYCKRWYGLRWHDHVEGWLDKGRNQLNDDLLVLKFEELKKNPLEKVQEVVKFLDVKATQENIENAVEMASIERAREREKREFGEIENQNMSFYRGGASGQYSTYLEGAIYDNFMRMSGHALRLAGYEE